MSNPFPFYGLMDFAGEPHGHICQECAVKLPAKDQAELMELRDLEFWKTCQVCDAAQWDGVKTEVVKL